MTGNTEGSGRSREFWDEAARRDAMWHVATGAATDAETFFASGRVETDLFLAHAGITPDPTATVLEIGCGIGRMTARLAELYAHVIALDVSAEMLSRAQEALADRDNIQFVLGNGADLADVPDGSVDVVFSYIVLQHVPTVDLQLNYLREAARVLRPGGRAAIQIRANTAYARGLDWAGHLRHRLQGRSTLSKAWRGARLPEAEVLALTRQANGAEVATIELRPYGRRHTWVVMQRTPAEQE